MDEGWIYLRSKVFYFPVHALKKDKVRILGNVGEILICAQKRKTLFDAGGGD